MRKLSALVLAPVMTALPLQQAFSAENVTISGTIEVEAGFSKDYNDVNSSDIALATVELGIDAQVTDKVTAHLLMLHEDDDTEPMEVDEGVIGIDLGRGLYLNAGRMYVPFGSFESNMLSDPLTLELGETREAAVHVGYENSGFYGSVYAFNGDTIETTTAVAGEDSIEHGGANLGYMVEGESFTFDVGVCYISSIGDSDGVAGTLDGNADGLPDPLKNYVSGVGFHAVATTGSWTGIIEHIAADKFDVSELAFNNKGAEPSATNIEIGYDFGWASAAIGVQSTDEALALGLPETRTLLTISKEIDENTNLSFEYFTEDDYATSDSAFSLADGAVAGSGKDASTITLQLAVSF